MKKHIILYMWATFPQNQFMKIKVSSFVFFFKKKIIKLSFKPKKKKSKGLLHS